MSKENHVYSYFRSANVMIATAKYNKQQVHGHCKFNPNDKEFNEEFAQKLSSARCDVKLLHRKEVNSRKEQRILENKIKEMQAKLEREREFEAKVHQEYLGAIDRADKLAHQAP